MESVVGFPPYAMLNGGVLEGEVVDVFNCVADRESITVKYEVSPSKRGIHDLRVGRIDAFLPVPVVEGLTHHWQKELLFTIPLHQGYWMLVHKAGDNVDVEPPLDDSVSLAMYRRASYHKVFDNVKKVSVARDTQMYKLLVSGRVDVISVFHPWPVETIQHYEGVDLKANLLHESPFRLGVSRKSQWASSHKLERLNNAILECRDRFKDIAYNPFFQSKAVNE